MTNNNGYYASECRAAVAEYRASAVRHRDSIGLRTCYLQLAWKTGDRLVSMHPRLPNGGLFYWLSEI